MKPYRREPSYYSPRSSTLDRVHLNDSNSPFRGFFTLFWLAMASFVVSTFTRNYQLYGSILSLRLIHILSQDIGVVFLVDMAMILAISPMLFWTWIVSRGLCPWPKVEMLIRHGYQAIWFLTSLYYIDRLDLPWVQTSFLTMHSISLLMKMHSYGARNAQFHWLDVYCCELKSRLSQLKKEEDEEKNKEEQELHGEIEEIEGELQPDKIRYPANITLSNWVDWLLIPTFVYELHYPRTNKIRIWYLMEKIAATLGTFWLLYITIEHYIIPVMHHISTGGSFIKMLPHLLFPFLIAYLLVFYIIFECIANGFAEISYFADRSFYDDWWNSITWDEFARKWNKPVHHFLLRHVYIPLRKEWELPRFYASLCTFLFSAILHELVIVVVAKRVKMYFFAMQMLQVPLIMVGERIGTWAMRTFGNAIFWFGMMVGPAILTYAYTFDVLSEAGAGLATATGT